MEIKDWITLISAWHLLTSVAAIGTMARVSSLVPESHSQRSALTSEPSQTAPNMRLIYFQNSSQPEAWDSVGKNL